MRDLTDKLFGVNLAQMFIRDLPGMVEFVVENEISFVTTSAGDPSVLVPQLKELGITVFHVVPTVRGAEKAIDAGVDGLVVEGAEGGGFKNADGASSLVLVPEIAGRFDVPIIAAGGIVDGPSMAAAFAMVPTPCRWAREWSPRRSHRSTTTGSSRSLMAARPAPSW